jgi:hypothetical protein
LKKLTAILLILCLTIPFAGTFSWFHYKKYLVKRELKWQHAETRLNRQLAFLVLQAMGQHEQGKG